MLRGVGFAGPGPCNLPWVWRDAGFGHSVEDVGNFLRRNGSPVPDRMMAHAQRLRSGPATERTMFFSDAVFAIAMTLLVLDLKLPDIDSSTTADELRSLLLDHVEPLVAFILSFILVGRLWINHHRKFTAIQRYDGALQSINLAALFFVVFLPVPTAMLFQANTQSPWPPVIYALTISGSFASLSWLWAHAYKAKVMHEWVDPALYRMVLHGTDPVWAVFLLSIPVAFLSPVWAMYSWVLIWPVSVVHGRWQLTGFARTESATMAEASKNTDEGS